MARQSATAPELFPPDLDLRGDVELAWRVWSILQAVDWKWTPLQVLQQPDVLLDDVMQLEGAYQWVRQFINTPPATE